MAQHSEWGAIQVREMSLDEIRELVQNWCDDKKLWHFHSLAPGCVFNAQSNRYALILENRTDDLTFVVTSNEEFSEISQELVKILHGKSILDKEQAQEKSSNEALQQVLERGRQLRQEGISWHHHMLFPDCVFNQHQGKWNIVFEGGDGSDVVELLYDEEPTADLRRIEVAYFR